jgi:hypothetical protein
MGKLAIYWNQNALRAFTEWNSGIERGFMKMGIRLSNDNYVPCHFGQAVLVKAHKTIIRGRNVLIVCGMDDEEFRDLKLELTILGAAHVEIFRCPATFALEYD